MKHGAELADPRCKPGRAPHPPPKWVATITIWRARPGTVQEKNNPEGRSRACGRGGQDHPPRLAAQ
eukprot:3168710-Pyramimonas_sp.AAC.1